MSWRSQRLVSRLLAGWTILTTKIHTVVDTDGLPLRFALNSGQAHDSTLAKPLLDDQLPADGFVLADKAYNAEWIKAMIEAQDAVPIIPDRSTAKTLMAQAIHPDSEVPSVSAPARRREFVPLAE